MPPGAKSPRRPGPCVPTVRAGPGLGQLVDLGGEGGGHYLGLGYIVPGQHLDDVAPLEDEDLVAEALKFERVRRGHYYGPGRRCRPP